MNPEIWGPPFWHLLHNITFSMPNNFNYNDRNIILNFFNSVSPIIPCIVCKRNYFHHYQKLPLKKYLKDKKTLCSWLIIIHNKVNSLNGKKNYNFNEAQQIHFSSNKMFIIYLLKILSSLSFYENKPSTIHNFFRFLKELKNVFPYESGKKIIMFFFQKYPIDIHYNNVPFFKNWFNNLEKSLMIDIKADN